MKSSESLKELERQLAEKHDLLEECQEKLDKANRQIDSLRIDNEGMCIDLDKAETMLEE